MLFGEFCKKMKVEIPEARIFDDYFSAVRGFDIDLVEQALKEWSMSNVFRFPAPNELNELLVRLAIKKEKKGYPKTIRDLFGNRVRTETPLARELRNIFMSFCRGEIDRQEADRLVGKAERSHGFANEPFAIRRKTPNECMAHLEKKERHDLRSLSRCLLPYGHFVVNMDERGLDIASMDEDSWVGSFDLLADYAERL